MNNISSIVNKAVNKIDVTKLTSDSKVNEAVENAKDENVEKDDVAISVEGKVTKEDLNEFLTGVKSSIEKKLNDAHVEKD